MKIDSALMNYSLISQPDRIRIPHSDSEEEEEEENKRKKAKVVEECCSRSMPGFVHSVTTTPEKRNSKDIPIKVDGKTFICIKFNC